MKLFQILEVESEQHHAGSKAISDVSDILFKEGFETIKITKRNTKRSLIAYIQRQIGYLLDWKKVYETVEDNAVVVLQHPFHNQQLTRYKTLLKLKKNKKIKIISIVHDVEEVRQVIFNDYYQIEMQQMMGLADSLIVHNEVMQAFFVEKGVPEEKIEVLEIFDYLTPHKETPIEFSRAITIAGNLDFWKSPYIKEIVNIHGLTVDLFGPNFNVDTVNNLTVNYHGSYPPSEIPNHLNKGFGLVWDGQSIDTCSGEFGQYLKFNSPHKLSLYIASGLPVVIWESAASAKLVEKYQIGLTIKSLEDLPMILNQIDEETYFKYVYRVKVLSEQLKNGYFLKKAIKQSLKKLGGEIC